MTNNNHYIPSFPQYSLKKPPASTNYSYPQPPSPTTTNHYPSTRSYPPRTPSTQQPRSPPSPTPTYSRADATLYFGGDLEDKNSLLGGNAWCLMDRSDKRIAHSSYAVTQTFPSQIRLEYEGLLNGLQAALMKRIYNIKIRGSCMMVISQYATGRQCPFLSSLYHSITDINTAILQALSHFQYVEFELISQDVNYFVYKLSKDAITTYYTKEKYKLEKRVANPTPCTSSSCSGCS